MDRDLMIRYPPAVHGGLHKGGLDGIRGRDSSPKIGPYDTEPTAKAGF